MIHIRYALLLQLPDVLFEVEEFLELIFYTQPMPGRPHRCQSNLPAVGSHRILNCTGSQSPQHGPAWQAFSVECGDEPPHNLPLVGVVLRTGNDPEGRAAVDLLWPWPAHGRARVAWSTFGLKIGFPQFQGIGTIDYLV